MEDPVAYDPDERIPRKDAARLARRSQDTIRRLERRHHLAVERDEASQQVTYRVQDLVDLGVLHIEDVATAGSAAESAELAGARETIAHLRADVAERDGRGTTDPLRLARTACRTAGASKLRCTLTARRLRH
ncbi:hypothetical protein GCM10027055_16490 [Janibacter alkaliphilus]